MKTSYLSKHHKLTTVSVESDGANSTPTDTSTRESAVEADGSGCKGETAVEPDGGVSGCCNENQMFKHLLHSAIRFK